MNMNPELRKIIDKIESLELQIAELRKKRDEIKNAPQKQKMKEFWGGVKEKEDKTEVAMRLIIEGFTASQAASSVGLTAQYVNQSIWRVWKKRYRKHYEANAERIMKMGLITALRFSPPIFTNQAK